MRDVKFNKKNQERNLFIQKHLLVNKMSWRKEIGWLALCHSPETSAQMKLLPQRGGLRSSPAANSSLVVLLT